MTGTDIWLGVNIDHVATLRQARGGALAGSAARRTGCRAMRALTASRCTCARIAGTSRTATCAPMRGTLQTRMNLEIAATDEMIRHRAAKCSRRTCCLVPEKRREVTTEGGLDVAGQQAAIADACRRLAAGGIRVSLFIDPDAAQVDAAARAGAPVVELHTGAYARGARQRNAARARAHSRMRRARTPQPDSIVHAGHGLELPQRAAGGAAIREIVELNIGHADRRARRDRAASAARSRR